MDMFIDGKWLPAQTGARLEVVNPATGALIDTVPDAAGVDADLAIAGGMSAGQNLDEGRFSRAIIAQKREHFPAIDVEIYAGERRQGAETLRHIARREKRRPGCR